MTYQETLDYLYSQLPMFHRIGAAAYKADLSNTIKMAELMGKPHAKLKCVHIAGTNGKGSSSHMLAAVLQAAGYTTGLYTSPHLVDFRERIRINGKMIPKHYVTDFVEKYNTAFNTIQPSFFEWTVALAFSYFVSEEVDIAIIETGLGGRLDSTNIITPKVALITNISYDHTNLLGDTLEKIAREKAGIIKPRVPTVISQYQSETAPVFSNYAREIKAPLEFADKNYRITGHKHSKGFFEVTVLNKKTESSATYQLDLNGHYQLRNLPGVLNTLEFIEKAGYVIEPEHIQKGLSQVMHTTGLLGRWQQLSQKPLVIADTAHNEDGIKLLTEQLSNTPYEKLHIVFGTVVDKELNKVLPYLPTKAQYYFVKADLPRAMDAAVLKQAALAAKLKGDAYASVEAGVRAALNAYSKGDLILITGSNFVVGEAMPLFNT